MRNRIGAGLALAMSLTATSVYAEFIGNAQGGTDFPDGAISFADAVVSYQPTIVGTLPDRGSRRPESALGLPDWQDTRAERDVCFADAVTDACPLVGLGDGGSLTLRFTDNVLTGSNDESFDLWVFEVGNNVERTFVEVSEDGVEWVSTGAVGGSTSGIDIDAAGFDINSRLFFVRLTDDPDQDIGPSTPGAEIDALGAISTTVVPLPASLWLMIGAVSCLVHFRRRAS